LHELQDEGYIKIYSDEMNNGTQQIGAL